MAVAPSLEVIDLRLQGDQPLRLNVNDLPKGFDEGFEARKTLRRILGG